MKTQRAGCDISGLLCFLRMLFLALLLWIDQIYVYNCKQVIYYMGIGSK